MEFRRYWVAEVTLGCTDFRMIVMQNNRPNMKICDTNAGIPPFSRSNQHSGEEAS
jgi:hypothetical protein